MVADDLLEMRWRKLVWNVPFNGLSVVLDANHPLAGMALRFTLEILSVRAATPEETARGVSLP